jgi:hypothetical protein
LKPLRTSIFPACTVLRLLSVRTGFGVDALISQAQPLHRPAADQVLLYDLRRIFGLDVPVPNRLGIHHHRRPVFALVKAPGLVDPNLAGKAGFLGQLLQLRVQLALSIGRAGGTRRIRGARIVADKNVVFKNWQAMILRSCGFALSFLLSSVQHKKRKV